MAEKKITENTVLLIGELEGDLEYSYEAYGEKFYVGRVKSNRLNNSTVDFVPITVSERLIDVTKCIEKTRVKIKGQYRSFNKIDNEAGTRHLVLSVFCKDIEILEAEPEDDIWEADDDKISLRGFLCKAPTFRTTPHGREVSDIMLAVPRSYGKSDYIPCITWGRNARFAADLKPGTEISVNGRIQSRQYKKRLNDTDFEIRDVYEISISSLIVVNIPEPVEEETTEEELVETIDEAE